jgi:filamentous hemagglutinin family protein
MPEIRQALNICFLHFARGQGWQLGLAGFLAVGGGLALLGNRATAQITPDATLGVERSVVKPNANIRGQTADLIEGGAARSANLFHSFQEFNVGDGQRVYFANPVGIENILTRVTGNTLSNIRGTLGVDGGANLFLLNPNGIIFGPNAKLDVAGSFVATTAKSLVFGNGVEFSATNPQAPPLLTINITQGVQYGSNQPGATIANAGNLAVGQNLTLWADNLDLQGQLSAGGDLTLQATDTVRVRDSVANPFIASAGGQLLVQGNQGVDILALNHPASVFSSGGDMVWRSANTVAGDARVRAGRNFRVEQLNGNLGNLSSPKDPVFEVAGDFSLANYTGASLQILAGGSVNIPGNITINGFGGAFNDSSVTLSDGSTLTLSGTTRPTLDIRAGTTKFFGAPTAGIPTSADISIGEIRMRAPDGVVFLTNQYAPNPLFAGGAIAVGEIRTDDEFGGFVGNSGSVIIDSRKGITVTNTNNIDSDSATGNAGNITLIANDAISLVNSSILSRTFGVGKGGEITIKTGQLLLSDGGLIISSTFGSGDGGDVTVNASSLVQAIGSSADGFLSGIYALVERGSTGNGGDVAITTPVLFLSDGAKVSAGNSGSGKGGNVTVNASSLVQAIGSYAANGQFVSGILAGADRDATGTGGDITINTPVLFLSNGAQVAASTYGAGDGGDVTVNASSVVQVIGSSPNSLLLSAIYSLAERGSTGNGGDVTINTPILLLADGSQVAASTFGRGDGGNVTINASSLVQLTGISTTTDKFPSSILTQADDTSTGDAGELRITTGRFIIRDGGNVSTATFGTKPAGFLEVRASNSIEISGSTPDGRFASGLYSDSRGIGSATGIRINTGRLVVENGGRISVSGRGSGISGNLDVTADSIELSNQGSLRATTEAGEGGNIRLKVADSLILRNNSEIVATATGTANGGNINVEAGSFIFGVLKEDSDIVADATQGQGGTITAKAPGIFGFRQFIDRRTPESDFTASSAVGLNGSVELNTQDKLEDQLPTNFVDGTQLIDRRCAPPKTAQERSSFTITGRGGLPPSPNDTLQAESVITNWVTLDSTVETNTPPTTSTPKSSAPRQLVEAQGWYFNEKGQVVLTASAPTVTPNGEWLPEASCNAPSARGQ